MSSRPSVLLIAPASNLPAAQAEIQRIANTLHPDLLVDNVTVGTIMDVLQTQKYEYIHFACHGGPSGIQLSNGAVIAPHQLVQILKSAKPECVFLNTCSSLELAMALHDANPNSSVIGTILDIDDIDAYITGALFAQAVASGKTYAQAYEASKPPANRKYVLLNGTAKLNGETDADDQKRLMMQMWGEMQRRMEDSDILALKTVETMRQMHRELVGISKELAEVKTELNRYQRRPTRQQAIYWASGYGVFCLVIALAYKDFRDALDFSAAPTLIVSLILLALAFVLFVAGLGFSYTGSKQNVQ